MSAPVETLKRTTGCFGGDFAECACGAWNPVGATRCFNVSHDGNIANRERLITHDAAAGLSKNGHTADDLQARLDGVCGMRDSLAAQVMKLRLALAAAGNPIPMRLTCPECKALHIDEGDFATKPHHTHSCQACGLTWRPAVVATVGVRFLPGFKGEVGR